MNIRDLKYLVALQQFNHFGKAAEFCCVSQPALSMQLKKLEEDLGISLIERGRSISLTEAGKCIAERAQKLLAQIEDMKNVAQQFQDPFHGELILGIIPTFAPYLLPLIMPHFVQNFPKLKIYLVEAQTEHLLDKLKQGTIDIAFLALPIEDPDFTSMAIFEEEFLLAVPKHHPLSTYKKINESDLKENSLLLLEEGHCLRDQALQFCSHTQITEDKRFRATSLETLRHMVAANIGITLIPKLAARDNDGICYLPFQTHKPKRIGGFIWRTSYPKKMLINTLTQELKKILSLNKKVQIIDEQN